MVRKHGNWAGAAGLGLGLCLLALAVRADEGCGPTGGPSQGARYPIDAAAYVSRFPDAPELEVPPTLEQLTALRPYNFDPKLGLHSDDFTLWTVDDLDRFDPSQQAFINLHGRKLESGDYHLVVQLSGAPALTDLFFYVRYDQDRWHPVQCNPGSAFGFEGDRLWYNRLDVPGLVCVGLTRIRPDVNGGIKFGDGVVCDITFANRAFDYRTPHWLERAPDLKVNRPQNLTAYPDPDDCTPVLYWTEVNVGDYNNDGVVAPTDMIVIGRRFGRISTDANEDAWDRMPDGNHDGEVNRRDKWLIDAHLGSLLSGYRVYRRRADEPQRKEVLLKHRTYPLLPMSIHRPLLWDPTRINEYRYHDRDLPLTDQPVDWVYRIVPYNAAEDVEGVGSDIEIKLRASRSSIQVQGVESLKEPAARTTRESRVRRGPS